MRISSVSSKCWIVRVSFIALFAAAAGLSSVARADGIEVVVPNSKENAGGLGIVLPFSYPPARYQQLNFASEFGAITEPTFITGMAFRAAPTTTTWIHTIADIQFNLSTAAAPALSGTFATNVGSDDTIVYRGSLVMDVSSPKSSLRPWEIPVHFDTPFLYDPSAGDLLLDVRILDNPNASDVKFLDSLTIPSVLARVYCNSNCSVDDSGGATDGGFVITRFTFDAPEPGSGVAGAAALLGLGLVLRGRGRG